MDEQFTNQLDLPHGSLKFPVYLPDATYGLVRSVDSVDLENSGIQAVVMNAFHLMQKPGSSTIQAMGGLHQMSGWRRPIITDSGGFQAYSLIRQNAKFGNMNSKGINFLPDGAQRKFLLTPEKSVQLQLAYGTDVVICLDDCTHVDASDQEQHLSVERTIEWAKRCRQTFDQLVKQKKIPMDKKPKLFGVIQGGGLKELRHKCAEALLDIGFDGFGYGGWPLDGEGNLLKDILSYTRSLIPAQYPMHALGIGHPYNVVACYDLGFGIFDCAMPTRDARHGRLYTFVNPMDAPQAGLTGKWLKYMYINDEEHIKSSLPIEPDCDCVTCTRYSRAYLRHIFKMNDGLYMRLATIHNLRFMTRLTDRIHLRTI